MGTYKLSNSALKDLSDIWSYTVENWSEKQADKYYNSLINSCQKLSKKPNLGKKYLKILPELRGKKILKHIIFYRVTDFETIEVIRILHERMDLKNHLI